MLHSPRGSSHKGVVWFISSLLADISYWISESVIHYDMHDMLAVQHPNNFTHQRNFVPPGYAHPSQYSQPPSVWESAWSIRRCKNGFKIIPKRWIRYVIGCLPLHRGIILILKNQNSIVGIVSYSRSKLKIRLRAHKSK